MAQIREIKKRIKAVRNIRRITNTMQMIATVKFKTSLDRAVATKPYTQKVRTLVQEVASGAGESLQNPLFSSPQPSPGRDLLLVLTSDRGLCGAYNGNVLRLAAGRLAEIRERAVLEVSGKKGAVYFRYAGYTVSQVHRFGDKPSYARIEALAQQYIGEYIAGKYDTISVVFMRFLSAGRQKPVIETLLPLQAPVSAHAGSDRRVRRSVDYEFSPDAASLLAQLLPITVKSALYQAFNDAVVSENIARMVAMKAATDNAGKLSKTLRRNYNRARQAQITTELSEIIGGAASLA